MLWRPFICETVQLAPQLKRISLGGAMKTSVGLLCLALASIPACGRPRLTLDNVLTARASTPPDLPVTTQDTVLRLVLEQAVSKGIPDFTPRSEVILLAGPGVSARVLPKSDSVRFFVLEKSEIQSLANQTGDLVYLSVGVGSLQGDRARAGGGSHFALGPHKEPMVLLAGGGCSWWLSRHTEGWVVDSLDACLIS